MSTDISTLPTIETKVCTNCLQILSLTEFISVAVNKDGLAYHCKECRSYRSKIHSLRTKYGLSMKDYEEMLAAQNGTCMICEKPETAKDSYGGIKMLAVDHEHSTGQIRGLLCSNCNRGLGFFQDDPDLLELAANYLGFYKEHEQ